MSESRMQAWDKILGQKDMMLSLIQYDSFYVLIACLNSPQPKCITSECAAAN